MTDAKEILEFIKKKGGRAKTMTVFFVSECKEYYEFSVLINKLEKEGKLQKTGKYGEYLEVI